ncbi:MAG: hypothetical protein IIA14_09900, partial [SAR324 cluster bacterium]|nr:hypothetical protein [SAR324 cluster bacterium]
MNRKFFVSTRRWNQTAAVFAVLLAALAPEPVSELRAAPEFTPQFTSYQWPIPGGIARIAPGICSGSDRIVVESRSGKRFEIVVTPGGLAPREISDCAPVVPATRPGILPDGNLARGERNIREA